MNLLVFLSLFAPVGADEPKARTAEQLTADLRGSVCVVTTRGREARREGLGTGFVIAADGLIATNAHVIGEGRPISVEFADGKKYDVTAVHAHDVKRDLAILKIDAKDLKPIPLGDSEKVKDGQAVVAFGNPKGLKYSVVKGVVSAVREIDGRKMIQVAIPVEVGNSGGPLVDERGRVQGIVTLKSLVTENLAFAGGVNDLKPLIAKPNSVPMSSWVTIGILDPDEWKAEMGARWTQRAGRVLVEEPGTGFGGRSICVWQRKAPALPFDLSVRVKLDDERGAAGLIFRHDGEKHYGFYPTGGKLRLTRFEGADVNSWTILKDVPTPHYKEGDWNTLRVHIEKDRVKCYVNEELVLESMDSAWAEGQVGLAKFRDTKAEFRGFKVGASLAATPADAKAIRKLLDQTVPPVPELAKTANSQSVLREQARDLERQATRLKDLAAAVHQHRVYDELTKALVGPDDKIDLIHAALLLAKLDNEEIEIEPYRTEVERMAKKVRDKLPKDADDAAKLKALNSYLFEQRGFHGSRGDYYNRSNSYLNEVIDDREGLPISLCVLYLEVARRIGVPLVGVGLPGHFVLRHAPKAGEGEGKFVDVYERGELMTADEAKDKATTFTGRPTDDSALRSVTKKAIVIRMLHNLLGVARREQDVAGGLRYLDGLLILDPEDGQSRLMRAGIYLSKSLKKEALADVDYLIAHPADGVDNRQLQRIKRSLMGEE